MVRGSFLENDFKVCFEISSPEPGMTTADWLKEFTEKCIASIDLLKYQVREWGEDYPIKSYKVSVEDDGHGIIYLIWIKAVF